jgi:hypothetical protein
VAQFCTIITTNSAVATRLPILGVDRTLPHFSKLTYSTYSSQIMCYGARVEDPGNCLGVPASVRGTIAWLLALGVIGWFIFVCTSDRPNFLPIIRVGFIAGVWSAVGLVIFFNCSYILRPGRVAGDDTMHAVQHSHTTSRVEGNYIVYTTSRWYVPQSHTRALSGPRSVFLFLGFLVQTFSKIFLQSQDH